MAPIALCYASGRDCALAALHLVGYVPGAVLEASMKVSRPSVRRCSAGRHVARTDARGHGAEREVAAGDAGGSRR